MKSGRTYEVFVDDKPIGLVGSTTRSLEQRRKDHYPKRFGPTVELRLIREIPRPEGYSDQDYNFYLKACEAMDIARKKTYVEYGGLNKISPLIQAYGHPMLEREMGRIGGKIVGHIAGRRAVDSGQLNRIRTPESCAKGGRKTAKSGRLATIGAKGGCVSGPVNGRKNVESGHLASIRTPENQQKASRIAHCKRWNINRGKFCVCGKHQTLS